MLMQRLNSQTLYGVAAFKSWSVLLCNTMIGVLPCSRCEVEGRFKEIVSLASAPLHKYFIPFSVVIGFATCCVEVWLFEVGYTGLQLLYRGVFLLSVTCQLP